MRAKRSFGRLYWRRFSSLLTGAAMWVAVLSAACLPSASAHAETRFDHVYVIVLENHGFDDALYNGPSPFMRQLAQEQGLATLYFGVAHPSLPNYLALIGGDDFGIRDDRPSCFASDISPSTACNKIAGDSLVGQLKDAGLSFAIYAETLPATGSLVSVAPGGAEGALYAQKHNPVPYFETLATDSRRARAYKTLFGSGRGSRGDGAECFADRAQPVP